MINTHTTVNTFWPDNSEGSVGGFSNSASGNRDLQEQAKGSRVMLGAEDRVFTKQYKSGNKLKWLQEYDELRARGLGMRTAMRGAYA